MALPHSASLTLDTVWTSVSEDQFVRAVQRVREDFAQVEARIHDQKSGRACSGNDVLPYNVEYQLAQDIAFLAAREEGVHTVSAATVETITTNEGIRFTVASNSGVGPLARDGLLGIGKILERCARKGNADADSPEHLLRRYPSARTTALRVYRECVPLYNSAVPTSDYW